MELLPELRYQIVFGGVTMAETLITCKHNVNGSGYCDMFDDYCVEGPCASEELVEYVPVVRCQDCIYAVPLDRNCELNETAYLHCNLWRGEETKNVWHKYKKYYKDYSLVDRDGFCSSGERRDNETD